MKKADELFKGLHTSGMDLLMLIRPFDDAENKEIETILTERIIIIIDKSNANKIEARMIVWGEDLSAIQNEVLFTYLKVVKPELLSALEEHSSKMIETGTKTISYYNFQKYTDILYTTGTNKVKKSYIHTDIMYIDEVTGEEFTSAEVTDEIIDNLTVINKWVDPTKGVYAERSKKFHRAKDEEIENKLIEGKDIDFQNDGLAEKIIKKYDLKDTYTADEFKKIRKKVLKKYHPDINKSDNANREFLVAQGSMNFMSQWYKGKRKTLKKKILNKLSLKQQLL